MSALSLPSELVSGELAEDERLRCICGRHFIYDSPDRQMIPCLTRATAEDRLCDQCRGDQCTLLSMAMRDGPDEPVRRHVTAIYDLA